MAYEPFIPLDSSQYGTQVVLAVSIVMLVAGIISLLYGWKLYRWVVIASTALAGAALGWYIVSTYQLLPKGWELLGPVILGILGGILALPLQRAAVFVIGATVGFITVGPAAAHMIWMKPGPNDVQVFAVSLLAFALLGVIAVFLFRTMVVVATSMFGATLAISGIVKVIEVVWFPKYGKNPYTEFRGPLLVVFVVLAILGIMYQSMNAEDVDGKSKRKKPAAEEKE